MPRRRGRVSAKYASFVVPPAGDSDDKSSFRSRKSFLGSLCDFYESLLNKLRGSSHGIRVDLNVGQQVGVAPVVSFGGRAAQFDAHAALYQVRHEVLVGIARGDVSIGIVGGIVQRRVAGIGVKDGDHLGFGVRVVDIAGDGLEVEDRGRQIAFERQSVDAVHRLHVLELHRDIDM